MASQTIASYWLPQRLVAFRARHPQVAVKALIGNTAEVAEAVADGKVEIGLVEGAVHDPVLEQTLVGRDRLTIVAPCPSRLGEETAARRFRICSRRIGCCAKRAPARARHLKRPWRKKAPIPRKLKIALELPSNEAVRLAVREGAGVSALSELVAEGGLRFGALAPVKFPLPERAFHALRHKERYLSKSGMAFMATGEKRKAELTPALESDVAGAPGRRRNSPAK